MVVNEKLDYEMACSKRTSSVLSPLQRRARDALATPRKTSGVLKQVHLNQIKRNEDLSEEEWEEYEDVESPMRKSMEKDCTMKKNQCHQQHQFRYSHSGHQQRQHVSQQAPKSSLRSGPQTENIGNRQALGEIRTKELSKHQSEADKPVKLSTTVLILTYEIQINPPTNNTQHRPKKSPEKPSDGAQATPLIPVGRVSHRNRVKHRRLNGSDLYVVRLGRPDNAKSTRCSSSLLLSPITEPTPPDAVTEDTASEISDSSRTSSTSTGSLHDELLNPHPKPSPPISPAAQVDATFLDVSAIRSSRPCYRCIEAMHSAGVKRVFWTEEGSSEWRGAKVRDLVAVLDGTRGSDGSSGVEQMFVTKHELLMLRRCMVGGKE